MRKFQMLLLTLLVSVFIPFFSFADNNNNLNGWVSNDGKWSFYNNGSLLKGTTTPDKYYVDSNGYFVNANNNKIMNTLDNDFLNLDPSSGNEIFKNQVYTGTQDDVTNILYLYNKFYVHSEYLHFQFQGYVNPDGSFDVLNIKVNEPTDVIKKSIDETRYVDNKINEILPKLKGNNEEETLNNIVNYITDLVDYDESLQCYSVYDMFAKRKTVCDGYMKLFYILCEKSGLQAECIESDFNEDALHGYNSVIINGQKRYVDLTFYDAAKKKEKIWLNFNPNIDKYHDKIVRVYG